MIAFFPYLKTSERFRYRNTTFRTGADREGLSAEEQQELDELCSLFFLRDHHRITAPTFAICKTDAPEDRRTEFLRDLREARALWTYGYSSPHRSSGDGEPFLHYEHGTVFLFRRQEEVHRIYLEAQEGTVDALPPDYPQADERGYVRGFDCQVDGRDWGSVARGRRLYPPCSWLSLNLSQDLAHHWPDIEQSTAFGAVVSFFTRRHERSDLHARLLTSITWYNRSLGVDTPAEVALVHLAAGFECLLALEQGPQISRRFKEAILLLIGNVPRAELWIDQFYRARSEIVHQGQASALLFQPRSTTASESKGGYRTLTTYGWLVFQICAAAIASGASVAHRHQLETLLVSNGQRFERICQQLKSSKHAPEERLLLVADDIANVADYRWVPERDLAAAPILSALQATVRTFLEARPEQDECGEELRAVAASKVADTLDALDRLRRLHDAIKQARWTTGREDRLRGTVTTLIDAAWSYLGLLYFQLKRSNQV
ncbi:MAG TPA: hypothetical protein VN700_14405 [Vicinamibacterales bacterium]|nr:hypothetical protein [Vicinamibacterales bacterium]